MNSNYENKIKKIVEILKENSGFSLNVENLTYEISENQSEIVKVESNNGKIHMNFSNDGLKLDIFLICNVLELELLEKL